MNKMLHEMTIVLALLLAGSSGDLRSNASADDQYPEEVAGTSAGITWESKYVSEGRDNLEDGGLFSSETSFEINGFGFGAWYAIGDSVNYQELNLSIEYQFEMAEFETSIGYTRLEFLKDDENDNEFSAGVAYTALPWIIPTLSYIYSTEAQGAFIEVSVRSDIPVLKERITLSPYILEGFDFGYATEEYDGPNNLQLGIETAVSATDQIHITGYFTHSLAHEDMEREGLNHQTWGGIGVSAEF